MSENPQIKITATDMTSAALRKIGKGAKLLATDFGGLKAKLGQVGAQFRGFVAKVATSNTKMGKATRATMRLSRAMMNLASKAKLAGRGLAGVGRFAGKLGGLLRGALTVGIGVAVGGVMALGSAFGAMKDAMEADEGATEGVASGAADAGKQMNNLAGDTTKAADESVKAADKMQSTFGAFGKVGEGFVQKQGEVVEQVAKQGEAAAKVASNAAETAKDAGEAMEDAGGAIDGATESTSRFGRALDRIGAAFNRAKTIILKAIAKAITPALEAFADLLESPAFQKFIVLLAKDLANAAKKVADWVIEKVIPAIKELMVQINEAGGPVEYIKEKFIALKVTALEMIGIILWKIKEWSEKVRGFFTDAFQGWKDAFNALPDVAEAVVGLIVEKFSAIGQGITDAMGGAAAIAGQIFNGIIGVFEKGINGIIDGLNDLVGLYNTLAEALGLTPLDTIPHIEIPRLAEGGIVNSPTLALIGEAGPEAVVPLDDAGGGYGDTNIYVTVPSGVNDPQGFGASVGDSIVAAMRAQGLRMPTI